MADQKGPKRLEILYNGLYYDVSDFVRRHPGGSIIKFYTEEGEDATEAIQQFHNRSINKIHLMLQSFKNRPAGTEDLVTDERNKALSLDFAKLFHQVKAEGLFKPSYPKVIARMGEIVIMVGIAMALLNRPNFLIQVAGSILLGIGSARAGWLMHEGGHNSLTGKPRVDKFIQSVFIGVFPGMSAAWWNRAHNKHHAMPQRMSRDIDLITMPLIAYNAKVVKTTKEGRSFFIQNQKWLFLSLDCLLGALSWQLYICPRSALRNGDWLDLALMGAHWTIFLKFVPHWSLFVLTTWVGANYMFGNFTLSHTHLPVTESPNHWVEYGLTHTANIRSSPFMDWWMGYLNFQIEHHLFPTLPNYKAHRVSDRVKALALKYNLPYHELSYMEAWRATLHNLDDVAKSFRD